jgi:phosphomannomutase
LVEVVNGNRDVLFGGKNPEPAEENLTELKTKMTELKTNIGLANDGDADRFGVIDEKGAFLGANQIIPLLTEYLLTDKKWHGSVVRSIATSNYVDRVAAKHGVKLHETPVGFKYIAQIMLREPVVLGGEESGGLTVKGHIPEKDGILACLLMVEMLAKKKRPLSKLWSELINQYGPVYTYRSKLELGDERKAGLMTKLKNQTPSELAGLKVVSKNELDGVKLTLQDKSWVLVRPSGTEPLIRIYAEADQEDKLARIVAAVKILL